MSFQSSARSWNSLIDTGDAGVQILLAFVSNVRGPETRLSFLERPITSIIPLSAASGNVTVSFAVLSYAGSLTITLVADPDTCPDLSALRDVLEEEVHALTAARPPLTS